MISAIDGDDDHGSGQMGPRTAAVVYARGRSAGALAEVLGRLGYEVRADEPVWRPDDVKPSVAFVGRHDPPELGLALIGRLAHDAVCPVVALVPELDPAYVREAGRRGAFGVVLEADLDAVPAVVEIARARFAQYRGLQHAFARRATVEQAKGILMAQHGIDQNAAFDLLRAHARRNSTRVLAVAEAIVRSHALLVAPARTAGGPQPPPRRPSAPA
jgi:response regulator NasT